MAKPSMMALIALELFGLACIRSIAMPTMTFELLQAKEPEKLVIERIDLRGNRRIPEDIIRNYIHSKPGEPYSTTQLQSDRKALYETGFFESIEIQEKDGDLGIIVTFIVKESPIIGSKKEKSKSIADAPQGAVHLDASGLILDPIITGQRVLPYSQFEKLVQESAIKAGIPLAIIADNLQSYKESRPNRIIRPQEWRFSWLELLYKNNIPYDSACKFMPAIPFYSVDTGFLETMKEAENTESAGTPPLSVGNGVNRPIAISQPLPEYTDEARQARAEGIVVIQAVVRKDGTVGNCKILKGLGYGLDEAAIRTIRNKWKFQPGTTDNNEPVDVQINIETSFRLY